MNDNESEDTINAADLDPRTTPQERISLLGVGYVRADLYDALKAALDVQTRDAERAAFVKSDMLKAMQDARRALAYAQKYDTVMEIAYLKLDAAIEASKGDV